MHNAITHFTSINTHVLEVDSAQIPLWDAMICDTAICSVPRGNIKHKRTSQGKRGRTKPIPRRRTGHLTREVTSETTHVGVKNLCSEHFMVPGAQNFYSDRGTEPLWCQGHRTFMVLGLSKSARSTSKLSYCKHGVGANQVRKAFHFFAATPLQIRAGTL